MSEAVLKRSIEQGYGILVRERPTTVTIVVDPTKRDYGTGQNPVSQRLIEAIHDGIGHSRESFLRALDGVCARAAESGYAYGRTVNNTSVMVVLSKLNL